MKQKTCIFYFFQYDEKQDAYICPNEKRLTYQYRTMRTDSSGFTREFHVYECEDCRGCPFRPFCTKVKEGRNRKLKVNKNFQQQKEYVRAKLSEPKAGAIYRRRKTEVEPVFGCLKANLRFTRFSVRGKSKAENEMGFALMAVNLRKYAAKARGS